MTWTMPVASALGAEVGAAFGAAQRSGFARCINRQGREPER